MQPTQQPGYESTLTEAEIIEIIDFIKGWWTDEQRAYQTQFSEESMPPQRLICGMLITCDNRCIYLTEQVEW
ncbi:MAG: hypothetical protein ACOCXZ_03585 [Chloroflexota bacterium]